MLVMFRSMPLANALCLSIIGGYLLLPGRAGMDLTLLPSLSKDSVPSMAALVMCLLLAQSDRLSEQLRGTAPGGRSAAARDAVQSVPLRGVPKGVVYGLLGLMLVFPALTVLNNSEALVYGPMVIGGMRAWDYGSVVQEVLVTLIPFVLGLWFLGTTQRHVVLLRTLVILGLGYSVLVAYEIRMSPQLNVKIYGFFPHSFAQHARGDGFRPVVFLNHGLWLAIFMATATLAACVLWRQALRARVAAAPWILAAVWLFLMLALSRSLGALVLVILVAPIVLLTPPRTQILVAAVLAGLVLVFPMLRGAGYIPTDALVQTAERIDPARAQSLAFRFYHEDMLLEHANRKPVTGWGTWSRNRVFNAETGRDISVTDGAWVIFMGQFGWVGYLARFGLLTLPIIFLALRRKDMLAPATTGLALVASAGLVDLIPNGTITPLTWLVGGALAGRYVRQERPVAASQTRGSRDPEADGAVLPAPAQVHVRQTRGLALAGPAGPHQRQPRN
ncbi:O-antigen ligase family protein [Rhodobaculum claviforme]|nr:O-antigen ligase family protein [Rhodobaculum claviforme]